jgi:hypothetical protein
MQELSVNRLPNLMMGQAIEQRGRHLGITEGARPLSEARFVVTMIEVRS